MEDEMNLMDFEGVEYPEYISEMFVKLESTNEELKELIQRKKEIYINFPRIEKLFDDELVDGLSKEECKTLLVLMGINRDIQSIYEKKLFFLGGKEAYIFFKNIGIIQT